MKRASLSLHHLTAMDVEASEVVSLAAEAGCENVCLFTYMPAAFRHKYPLVSNADVKSLRALMQGHAIGCLSLEVFPLTADADFRGMEEGLAIGAELGAQFATVHSHFADPGQAHDALARLADIAAPYAITLGVEFNPFSAITTLAQATALIKPLRSANVGLVLDTLHAVRSGALPAAIAAARDDICLVQISDGPASMDQAGKWNEALRNRMVPGEGAFPLVHMLEGLQAGLPVSIEVPQGNDGSLSVSPAVRVKRAVTGARKTLAAAGFSLGS